MEARAIIMRESKKRIVLESKRRIKQESDLAAAWISSQDRERGSDSMI